MSDALLSHIPTDVEAEDKAVLLTSQSRSPFYWASKTAARKEMQIMINGRTGWSYGVSKSVRQCTRM